MSKGADQHPSRIVGAYHSDGQNVHPQISKIVNRIGTAARNDGALAMLQNQDWGFTRDARNLSEDELVSHQITQNGDRDFGAAM
jgi:hypothetical protein